jgi:hypothetical protein
MFPFTDKQLDVDNVTIALVLTVTSALTPPEIKKGIARAEAAMKSFFFTGLLYF